MPWARLLNYNREPKQEGIVSRSANTPEQCKRWPHLPAPSLGMSVAAKSRPDCSAGAGNNMSLHLAEEMVLGPIH